MASRGAHSVPQTKVPRAAGDKRSVPPQRSVGGTSRSEPRLSRHPAQNSGRGGNASRRGGSR